MHSLVGRNVLNRYRVDAFIGRGGMAEVYKVWDNHRAVYLAMKVLNAELAEDIIFLRRFEREAQTLEKLKHPNIVRFYGLEREGTLAFMLMDFIEGNSLRHEIFQNQGNAYLSTRSVEVMKSVCAALHYAHSLGMVHCDIKPSNILVKNTGNILVADFGIARMTDAATMTMVGTGTPAYMAPEQILGKVPLPQTDIYALGIVLYEMISGGERPFTGEFAEITGSTREKVLWEHMNTIPPPLSTWNDQTAPEIEAVVKKCLEKEPDNRYPNTLALLDDLTDAFEKQSASLETAQDVFDETLVTLPNTHFREDVQASTEIAPEPTTPISEKSPLKLPVYEIERQQPVLGKFQTKNKWVWGVIVLIGLALVLWGGNNFFRGDVRHQVDAQESGPIGGFQIDTPTNHASSTLTRTPNNTPESPIMTRNSPTITTPPTPSNTVRPVKPNSEVMIAYAYGVNTDSDIYIYYIDSRRTERVTHNDYEDRAPSFSWDNTRLVYQSDRESGVELYVYDLRTGREEKITNFNGEAKFPSWSPIPGDERIVFEGREGDSGKTNVWLVKSDGSGLERVTNSDADSRPSWSGDGSYIVFGRATRDSWDDGKISSADYLDIFTLEIDSGRISQLTNTINKDEFQYSTSPDGMQIVFNSVEQDQNDDGQLNLVENRNLHIVGKDGSGRYSIKIDNKYPLYAPGWSPDGRYLSFTIWFSQDELKIMLYDRNTDQTIELFGNGPYYHPEWSK